MPHPPERSAITATGRCGHRPLHILPKTIRKIQISQIVFHQHRRGGCPHPPERSAIIATGRCGHRPLHIPTKTIRKIQICQIVFHQHRRGGCTHPPERSAITATGRSRHRPLRIPTKTIRKTQVYLSPWFHTIKRMQYMQEPAQQIKLLCRFAVL